MVFIDSTLRQFADSVAAKSPTPGGGSVAAYASTLGAALGVMAARYSEGPAAVESIAKLTGLSAELIKMVDRDSEAYQKVTAAYQLPKATDDDKKMRRAAIQEALILAADIPLQGMRLSVEAMRSLDAYAATCNKNLVSDLASGALMLAAGLEGCSHNVRINAGSMTDKARAGGLEKECSDLLAEGARLAASVKAKAEKVAHPA